MKAFSTRVFNLRQLDGSIVRVGEAPCTAIELPTEKSATAPFRDLRRIARCRILAPQHGPDARDEFAESERFREIIIGSKIERCDPLDFVASMAGYHDDGNVGAQAELAQQVKPVFPTKMEIDDDDVGLALEEQTLHLAPTTSRGDVHAVVAEKCGDQLTEFGIVIDNQDPNELAPFVTHEFVMSIRFDVA